MAKHRNYSTEFKRQVVLEYLAGETLHGVSKRHVVIIPCKSAIAAATLVDGTSSIHR